VEQYTVSYYEHGIIFHLTFAMRDTRGLVSRDKWYFRELFKLGYGRERKEIEDLEETSNNK
jgi:hypothetical protein